MIHITQYNCTLVVALTIALSLAVAKQARHVVRVDTWLCELSWRAYNVRQKFT